MKNKKRNSILAICTLIVIAVIGTVIYTIVNNESRLTTSEKKWITNNTSTVQSLSVPNDLAVFGNNGQGVFYDFINDIKKEYNLTINPVTYSLGNEPSTKGFKIKTDKDEKDLVFYEDHYVLLAKSFTNIPNIQDLENQSIGILTNEATRLKDYFPFNINFTNYETIDELFTEFNNNAEITYLILPYQQYLVNILDSNYEIVYHFSDLKDYFVYEPAANDEFSNIVSKYFLDWEDKLKKSLATNTLNAFVTSLHISQQELSEMQSQVYEYGFINTSPYEIIMGGNYGGIISEYLREFSDMSNIEFNFHKYNSVEDFNKAIQKGDINIYFDYYNFSNDYQSVKTTMNINLNIVAPYTTDLNVKSLKSLKDTTIYVLDGSKIKSYLETIPDINLKVYNSEKELKKLARKGETLALDAESYAYYHTEFLNDYTVRYQEETNINYDFKLNTNDVLVKLFQKYISTLDAEQIVITGLHNHATTMDKGSTLGTIAKYTLLTFAALAILVIIMYRSSKKIKIATRIKKEDKMKYIDQLTSLKNRNYLTENISHWNKNTIYPQAAIIVDLNNLQEINDTLGYEHGDAQIKAAANILIKTQLDNSDIIRTDGNEFLIYLVGYSTKQIISYIKKLSKEFKNLPYEHSAAIGYSMITDNIKTLEDAMNEAVEDMRTKKEEVIEE